MKQLLAKLKSMSKEIAEERDKISLFALFLREDAGDRWDLIVSAPWVNTDSMEDYKYIADKLKHYLEVSELLSISRIVLLDTYDSIVQTINNYCGVKPGDDPLEVYPFSIGLSSFKYAYIIISMSQTGKPVSVHVGKRKLRQTL